MQKKKSLLLNLDQNREKKLKTLVRKYHTNKTHFIFQMIDEAYTRAFEKVKKKNIDLPPVFEIGLAEEIHRESIYSEYLDHKYE